jgi:lipid-binding SYLF domain-containing protein
MRLRTVVSSLALILLAGTLASAKDTPDQKKDKTRKMASQTLEDLYKLQPSSRELIQKSAGYAVFNNMGANLLLLSTARGAGIAVNSKSKQDTFMKMVSAGAGFGVGVKDYRVVFAFDEREGPGKFSRFWLGCFRAN